MPIVSEDELEKRREEILDGARTCFAIYGYEGATVRRLEETIGKTRGAIFHHFVDKENLFLALAREDAAQEAEVVARDGLVTVMRAMLKDPEKFPWLGTRLEITRLIRTDPHFRMRWRNQQAIVDHAVRTRLEDNIAEGRLRTDVPVEVLQDYLQIVLDGFIARLAAGHSVDGLEEILDLVEESVRRRDIAENEDV